MRRTLAAVLVVALWLHPLPAHARGRVDAVTQPARCRRGPLSGVNEVKVCWGPLLRSCKAWDANRMALIVWRESRGNPLAYNKTPVRVRGPHGRRYVHAFGLVQRLDEHSTNPVVQVRNGCELARNAVRAGKPWWWPWKATR